MIPRLTKGGLVDQQAPNKAYDRLAFIADHYNELCDMYQTLMEYLKLPEAGGGTDTHLTKTFDDTYGFVQLDKEAFKGWGYDLDNPTDVQFLINGAFINKDPSSGFDIVNYIEYLDKLTVSTKGYTDMFSRGMDDFFEKMPTITSDWWVDITVEGVRNSKNIYGYGSNTKANFLKDVCNKFPSSIFSSPMTVRIYPFSNSTDKNTFTYTSDTIENNPLYIVTYPAGFKTVNNVLVFPKDRPGSYNGDYMDVYIPQGASSKLDKVTVSGNGEIISTFISDGGDLTLKASSPTISYDVTETDKYTFTHTIDSALRNN